MICNDYIVIYIMISLTSKIQNDDMLLFLYLFVIFC